MITYQIVLYSLAEKEVIFSETLYQEAVYIAACLDRVMQSHWLNPKVFAIKVFKRDSSQPTAQPVCVWSRTLGDGKAA